MTTLHIGHAPRLPRRERIARVLTQLGRYVLAWGFVAFACWWVVDIHLFVPGLVLAAMVGNPWRPKRPPRPVRRVSARAVHSRLWRTSPRRVGLLSPLPPG